MAHTDMTSRSNSGVFECPSGLKRIGAQLMQTTKEYGGFCCAPKQYIMHNCLFTSIFEISPRAIIIKKKQMAQKTCFEKTILITNKGLYSREIDFGADADDTRIRISKKYRYHYIEPDQTMEIKVIIESKQKKKIHCKRRHVFIMVSHPNVILEIPIIFVGDGDEEKPSLPKKVFFQRSAPNSFSCYEFLLYNRTKEPVPTKITTSFKGVKIVVDEKNTPANGYIKVLLILCVTNLVPVLENIQIRFGKLKDLQVEFYHSPIPIDPHLSISHIDFQELKYMQRAESGFLICNDAENETQINIRFATESDPGVKFKPEPDDINPNDEACSDIQKNYGHGHDDLDSSSSRDGSASSEIEFIPKAYKHFQILDSQKFSLIANGIKNVCVEFRPDYEVKQNDVLESPFHLITKLLVEFVSGDYSVTKFIIITGQIRGPAIFVSPKAVDMGKIYLGEEQCGKIEFENLDGLVDAKVTFACVGNKDAIFLTPSPPHEFIVPALRKVTFSYILHSIIIGKFILKFSFRVENSVSQVVLLKGHSLTLALKATPAQLNIGQVPICIPQVRTIYLMNPSTVPVTAQLFMTDDGIELPLVLNIEDVEALLPVTVKDPVKHLLQVRKDEETSLATAPSDNDGCFFDVGEEEDLSKVCSLSSFHSVDSHSNYSIKFQYEVLEPMPDIAREVVHSIKMQKIINGEDVEINFVNIILRRLLDMQYFHEMDLYKNYAFMDWSALPSDPKEVYLSKEILCLPPKAGKKLSVLIIPNKPGQFFRTISCRVCPQYKYEFCPWSGEGKSTYIDSSLMISSIDLIYECVVPQIAWNKEINFTHAVYIGEEYPFKITFTNYGTIGGFLFFDVVPDCEKGVMSFKDGIWKFYVDVDKIETANCQIQFRDTGYTKLHGLVKTIGCTCACVFTVSAEVLPTELKGLPAAIHIYLNICERSRFYVYFENGSPIGHGLRYSLEKETKNIFLYPYGARLNPRGQGTYLTIFSFYKDPGRYFNTLHIDLQYLKRVSIPIYFIVNGIPIFTEPNLENGFHMGNLTTISVCEFHAGSPKHEQTLIFKNCGTRKYSVGISRVRAGNKPCDLPPKSARLDINPKFFILNPGERKAVTISAWAYEDLFISNDFLLKFTDVAKPKRFETKILNVTANFVLPKICWHPQRFLMEYHRAHVHQEHSIEETVKVVNLTNAYMHAVTFEALGPILVKAYHEAKFAKKLDMPLLPREEKDLILLIDKTVLKNFDCHRIECLISASLTETSLKSLNVRVIVRTPHIEILPPSLVLFVNNSESKTLIELRNVGCTKAQYRWRKISEEIRYVDKIDYEKDFIAQILSEIFHMIDISDPIDDEIEGENLSQRYQRYRCKLNRLEDEIGIRLIIDEIIDNLDLEHKRYMIKFTEEDDILPIQELLNDIFGNVVDQIPETNYPINECLCEEEEMPISSGKTIATATMNELIRKLKLEDSYQMTDPSSSYCNAERFVYFYCKKGELPAGATWYSTIHLPGLRKGYELTARFALEVMGDKSQIFTLTLVNTADSVTLSKHNIHLGTLPWYETFYERVTACNFTQYLVNIKAEVMQKNVKGLTRYLEGYVNLLTEKYFEIPTCFKKIIRLEGGLGFSHEYRREISMVVNGGEEMRVLITGQGIMPILSSCNLPHIQQTEAQIFLEYLILRKIFYYEMFKSYTEMASDLESGSEEQKDSEDRSEDDTDDDRTEHDNKEVLPTSVKFPDCKNDEPNQAAETARHSGADSDDRDDTSSSCEDDFEDEDACDLRELKRLLDTFVVVQKTDVPNRAILQQMMETEKFKILLSECRETLELLHLVYKEYWKFEKSHDPSMPLNLKHFNVQTLPFFIHGYEMELGILQVGRLHKFQTIMGFLGPGQMIVQARMAVDIPGLFVCLYTENMPGCVKELFCRPERKPESMLGPYRNMWERIVDQEADPKLKHAHSFDIDFNLSHLHKRNCREPLTAADRANLLEYYSSLNKSVYQEQRHHPVLCKMYAQGDVLYSGPLLHIILIIKPEAKFYTHEQFFEEYLYIDVHMGPIIPIALKGQIMCQ